MALRHVPGALNLETIEARPVFDGDELKDFEAERKHRAEDIMANCHDLASGGDRSAGTPKAEARTPWLGRGPS